MRDRRRSPSRDYSVDRRRALTANPIPQLEITMKHCIHLSLVFTVAIVVSHVNAQDAPPLAGPDGEAQLGSVFVKTANDGTGRHFSHDRTTLYSAGDVSF